MSRSRAASSGTPDLQPAPAGAGAHAGPAPASPYGDKMKRTYLLLAASFAPFAVQAHDFPTSSRVEYVLECMQKHEGKYEYLYKCSCAIDHIAKDITYD